MASPGSQGTAPVRAVLALYEAVIVPEPGYGQPLPVTSVYDFRGSLITSIESAPGR